MKTDPTQRIVRPQRNNRQTKKTRFRSFLKVAVLGLSGIALAVGLLKLEDCLGKKSCQIKCRDDQQLVYVLKDRVKAEGLIGPGSRWKRVELPSVCSGEDDPMCSEGKVPVCVDKPKPPSDPCRKNGICEPGETKKNCPSDCVDCNGRVISRKDKKDPSDCKKNEKYNAKTCRCDKKGQPPPDPCRKNGICEPGETKKNCPSDCVDCNGRVISRKDKKDPSDCKTNEVYNRRTCKCDKKEPPPDPCNYNKTCEQPRENIGNCSDCVDCSGTVISSRDKKNPADCNTNEMYNGGTCKCDPKPACATTPKPITGQALRAYVDAFVDSLAGLKGIPYGNQRVDDKRIVLSFTYCDPKLVKFSATAYEYDDAAGAWKRTPFGLGSALINKLRAKTLNTLQNDLSADNVKVVLPLSFKRGVSP